MGVEGSKTKENAIDNHSWLPNSEKQIILGRIKKLSGTGNKTDLVSVNSLLDELQVKVSNDISGRFVKLIARWSEKISKNTHSQSHVYSTSHLFQVLTEILNPSPSSQLDVLMYLSEEGKPPIEAEKLLEVVSAVIECYCNVEQLGPSPKCIAVDEGDCKRLAIAWLHHVVYGGASFKQTAGKPVPTSALSEASVERWLLGHAGMYLVVQCSVLRYLTSPDLISIEPRLLPEIQMPSSVHMRLSTAEVLFLNTALPSMLRNIWRLLFANQIHGDSFSNVLKQIVGHGPSLVVVETEDGFKFGGFASASWQIRPQFHGTAESFLYSLRPTTGIFRSTGYNDNFQYLNFLHNNTMPNGLGMGGREELFGFFLSGDDFGTCTVAPTCTTYQSPPLCPAETVRLKNLLVFGVGEEPKDSDDDDEMPAKKPVSALDRDPEAKALLAMIDRGRASEGLREPEEQ